MFITKPYSQVPRPVTFELFRDSGSTASLSSLFQKPGVKCFVVRNFDIKDWFQRKESKITPYLRQKKNQKRE